MFRIDVHQHIWTEPLIVALERRRELPFARRQDGLTTVHLAGERPYVIDPAAADVRARAELCDADGVELALICLSSPLGIEWLPREEAMTVLAAYHEGALSLGRPFGVWGALPLRRPEPDDVDYMLERGCEGISLPAGALGGASGISLLGPLLERLEQWDAPLMVHPGPGPHEVPVASPVYSLQDPLWWPALTRYVAQMQAAWMSFATLGRTEHPRLRVVFSMLAGLAPLHAERLRARGGPAPPLEDPLIFYDISSYGPDAVAALAAVVGPAQLVYGSDRPLAEPARLDLPGGPDRESLFEAALRALGTGSRAGLLATRS